MNLTREFPIIETQRFRRDIRLNDAEDIYFIFQKKK